MRIYYSKNQRKNITIVSNEQDIKTINIFMISNIEYDIQFNKVKSKQITLIF